jgi:flavin-binding protein dodecin
MLTYQAAGMQAPAGIEWRDKREEEPMSVARVTEITSTSTKSFEDAIKQGIKRATKTLRNVKSTWIKEQTVRVDESGAITEYQVNMLVTFVLED